MVRLPHHLGIADEFGVVAAGGGVEMLQIDRIKAAAEDVVAAALLAEGWTTAELTVMAIAPPPSASIITSATTVLAAATGTLANGQHSAKSGSIS